MVNRLNYDLNLEPPINPLNEGLRALVRANLAPDQDKEAVVAQWVLVLQAAKADRITQWEQQMAADLLAEEQAAQEKVLWEQEERDIEMQRKEAERWEAEKKKPKIADFVCGVAFPQVILPNPLSFAMQKLRNFEFVSL